MSNKKKILLLNSNFEILSFVDERRAIKYLIKDKTEVISNWNNEEISFASGSIKLPAILRLKHEAKRNYYNTFYSRYAVMKRDQYSCQYCRIKLLPSEATIDHIIPCSRGGKNSFTNCVVSCFTCNNSKGNRTPEEAGMTLIRKPAFPDFSSSFGLNEKMEPWHNEWSNFIKVGN